MTESIQLLDLSTTELLEKIGAGSHKPGSGSAAALNGILSCQLLLTVAQLTLEPKRKKEYSHCFIECIRIQSEINERIYPRLRQLFQEDSVQFDRAILKRQVRDSEKNQAKKNYLEQEALNELVQSTELPVEIASLSIELVKHSIYVFDNGFKAARGDSMVALGNALASISGCISIVSLNLGSFPSNGWTTGVLNRRDDIQKYYNSFLVQNSERMNQLDIESQSNSDFLAEISKIRTSLYGKLNISIRDIEDLAKKLQNSLWLNRNLVWKTQQLDTLIEILSSKKVIRLLKYDYREKDTLGVNDLNQEIAGIINNEDFTITVSSMFAPEVRKFTLAHELGHALLHNKIIQHRDIPLDGSETSHRRPIEEIQADKFATFFLMPEKVVRGVFEEIFQTSRITLNEQTAFAFGGLSIRELRKEYTTVRDFSRMIAKLSYFENRSFASIASVFGVSFEAMAIRLEELGLVKI